MHLRAHRTLTQKIAFDHHKAKPIDGSCSLGLEANSACARTETAYIFFRPKLAFRLALTRKVLIPLVFPVSPNWAPSRSPDYHHKDIGDVQFCPVSVPKRLARGDFGRSLAARLQGQTCPQGLYMPTTALEHKRRPDLGQSALAALPAYLGQAPEPNVFVENAKTPGPAAA